MAASFKNAVRRRNQYVKACGGYSNTREADDVYNDLNRSIIQAMAADNGTCYLGIIQNYGAMRKAVASGSEPVFTKYSGQTIETFGCDYVIPDMDDTLEKMIREFNQPGYPTNVALLDKIMERLDVIGGELLLWT